SRQAAHRIRAGRGPRPASWPTSNNRLTYATGCCRFTTSDIRVDTIGTDVNTTTTSRIEYLPRSRRRTLVAVALAGYPVAVAALAALKHTSLNRWLILALFLLLLLPTLPTLAIGYPYASGRLDARPPPLH